MRLKLRIISIIYNFIVRQGGLRTYEWNLPLISNKYYFNDTKIMSTNWYYDFENNLVFVLHYYCGKRQVDIFQNTKLLHKKKKSDSVRTYITWLQSALFHFKFFLSPVILLYNCVIKYRQPKQTLLLKIMKLFSFIFKNSSFY